MATPANYDVQVYEDTKGEWRWRLVAPNGRIIADSGEGYVSRSNAMRAVNRLIAVVRAADEYVVEP